MITVNAAFLNEVDRNLVARYIRGLGRRATFYEKVAQVETSSSRLNIYPFLANIGTLREWVGDRVVDDLSMYDFAIKNRDFEKTMRVRKPDLEDDQIGMYGSMAEMLGDAANRHPDRLIRALIEGGFATNGFDGVPFFATTHPGPNGNQSNKGTTALSSTSFSAALQQMRALVDDGGELLDVFSDSANIILAVPPALEETARIILNQDIVIVGGLPTNNVWKGAAQLMVIPTLTDTNNWYLFDMGQILRPFIMQFRKRPVLTSLTSLTDENVFKRNEFLWGVDYRGEAGYALWQLAFGAAV